jgi:hypothetical protein
MFPYRTGKSSAGFFEQLCPLIWVELLSREHGNKVFIPELGGRPVRFDVVFIVLCSFPVHVIGIPGYVLIGMPIH